MGLIASAARGRLALELAISSCSSQAHAQLACSSQSLTLHFVAI